MNPRPRLHRGVLGLLAVLLAAPMATAHRIHRPTHPALGCPLGWDDPPKADESKEERPFPPAMEKREARELLKELKKPLQSKEPREKALAIERLKEHSSEEFVTPLVTLAKDRDPEVAVAALAALAEQNFDESRSALLRYVREGKVQAEEMRLHAAIVALERLGWDERGFRVLRELFEETELATKKELLRAFAARKEVRAFSLFVDLLDSPRPGDVNAASNPPASYWKEKYQEWEKLKHVVAKGLEQISGQRFPNAAAAIEWSTGKEAKKRGIQYGKGS